MIRELEDYRKYLVKEWVEVEVPNRREAALTGVKKM